MNRAYLALGSNIDAFVNTRRAVTRFAVTGELAAVSTFYRTQAVGGGPPFVNGVIAVEPRETDVAAFLARLRGIETALGRERGPDKNAPRTMDLDLVAWPAMKHDRLPRPDIERYDFVAVPLAELAPTVATDRGRYARDAARSHSTAKLDPLGELTRELRALLPARNFPL